MGNRNEINRGTFFGSAIQAENATVVLPGTRWRALGGLPAPSRVLIGRDAELADLEVKLAGQEPIGRLITGLPGAGKTELAVHAAHRALASGRYPGGVLFLDLFGYDEDRRVDPHRALGSLLRALGVPDEQVPSETTERITLYRSALGACAGESPLLVLLDNAGSSAQVRPLLPGELDVPVLVTSRHTLSDLGLRVLDLPVLAATDGARLLEQGLRELDPDDRRAAEQPDAAREVAELCGGLPLALAVVTALLGDLPARPMAAMAQSLRDTRRRLARLAREDLAVRAAFQLSYRNLPPDQARLFRLMSLNPGPDLSTGTAAHLAGAPVDDAEPLVHALARAHLVQPAAVHDRWRMHDLMRLYAEELCREKETRTARTAATERMLALYCDLAAAADRQLQPGGEPGPGFPDRAAALAWLDAEYLNLRAAALAAPELGRPDTVVLLHVLLIDYQILRRHLEDYAGIARRALDAARTSRDPLTRLAEPEILTNLGTAQRELRRFAESVASYQRARKLFAERGDIELEATVLTNLGLTYQQMGRCSEAVQVLHEALAMYPSNGSLRERGMAYTNLGRALHQLGRLPEAAEAFRADLAICRAIRDRHGEAITLNNLGMVLRDQDLSAEALDAFEAALRAAHDSQDHYLALQVGANLTLARGLVGEDDPQAVVDRLAEAAESMHGLRDVHMAAQVRLHQSLALVKAGRTDEAVDVLGTVLRAGRELEDLQLQCTALDNAGILLAGARRFAEAVECWSEAADLCAALDDHDRRGRCLGRRAGARQALGDAAGAREDRTAAAAAFQLAGTAPAVVDRLLAGTGPE
ncbi:tetratricopeptide repeat protein [Kitasatospora fiedleri]|uniref:tetratricopeptide repeat protein n=1 Tax=Kitasatospora fiedleri TaxID=2991545 RepID=UPI00249C16BC|nr:tetratricopeptide repeat protein [Kitasatospora fiedleri]